jgi:hypothetical protein
MNKNSNQNNRRNFLSKMLIVGTSGIALLSSSAYGKNRGKGRRSTTINLTDKQKADIFYMYQEEKVARDVYITFSGEDYYPNENTFASIQLSEQRHIDAVEGLCDKYGIDKKGVNEGDVGNFILEELKTLYDDCVIRGRGSLLEALMVGEDIELKDITDLEEAMVGMPSDVVNVFSNLREGSLNHLEAFQSAIARES